MSVQQKSIKSFNNKGFTLIELMVAIAIIAILAAVGLVVYSTTQKTARISKRLQDLKALNTAIITYQAANGFYPKKPVGATFTCLTNSEGLSASVPAFIPSYMQTMPIDPSNNTSANAPCYRYWSDANGTEYKIRTDNTEMTDSEYRTQPQYIDPERDSGTADDCTVGSGAVSAWAIYSGSTACIQ